MLNSYRWIVAFIFVAVSLFVVRERFSMGEHWDKNSTAFETLGIEEREIIYSVLSRLETQKQYQQLISKLDDTLKKDLVPALVSEREQGFDIKFKEGEGIIFPKIFFSSDPFTQELSVTHFLGEIAKSPQFSDSSLAKISKPTVHSKGAK